MSTAPSWRVRCKAQTQDDDLLCGNVSAQCDPTNPNIGPGPLTRVLRRELDPGTGAPAGPYEVVGLTCFPDGIPQGKKTLGLAQIIRAFNETKFAKPQTRLQPKGNVTLVTLPVFFEVAWPAAGYQPQEVDAVTLLGYAVRIRPTLEHFSYVFGDGTYVRPHRVHGRPLSGRRHHPHLRQARLLPHARRHHLRRRVQRERWRVDPHPRHRHRRRPSDHLDRAHREGPSRLQVTSLARPYRLRRNPLRRNIDSSPLND